MDNNKQSTSTQRYAIQIMIFVLYLEMKWKVKCAFSGNTNYIIEVVLFVYNTTFRVSHVGINLHFLYVLRQKANIVDLI